MNEKKTKKFDSKNIQQRELAHRLGYVKPMDNIDRYANAILSELFNSKVINEKISGIMYRDSTPTNADYESDMVQETFYHLSKYNKLKLIEAYEDNPARIIALATTIAVRANVSYNAKNKQYYKHSQMRMLLFGSNINNNIEEQGTIDMELQNVEQDYVSGILQEMKFERIWCLISEKLSDSDQKFINSYYKKSNVGQTTRKKFQILLYTIQSIVKDDAEIKKLIEEYYE